MTVPDDVREAAGRVAGIDWTEDALSREGGALMWATAESYYELLAYSRTLAAWVEEVSK